MAPDSPFKEGKKGGASTWQTNDSLKFKLAADASLRPGVPLYVRVRYWDEGSGLIKVSYNTHAEKWLDSENHIRSSRVNTGQFVESLHQLKQPAIADGSAFLRIRILNPQSVPLSIQSVTVADKPFDDPQFRQVIQEPWKKPLDLPPNGNPPRSLKGTIMVGYQGWFRMPNDLCDNGGRHWFKAPTAESAVNYATDMWPDMSAYPQSAWMRAGDLLTQSGKPALLFSSASPEVVNQHFRWMRESKIDGAFVQRFMGHRAGGDDGTPEWVLYAIRQAAHAEKRLWAIEYDVSGLINENAQVVLKKDWAWLVDELKITSDPYYARENGKPVVFLWGFPVKSRGFKPDVAEEVVRFFKNDPVYGGNYLIGGISSQWRQQPEWLPHLRNYDAILTWQGRNYEEDRKEFQQIGVKYYPHVWPGFSWSHLKNVSGQYTPREGGKFYWNLMTKALQAGNDWLFVGMFDEYDEGTAIMPMSDDAPPPQLNGGRFLINEGHPSMWWLKLTSYAKEILENQRSKSQPMPGD
ncbi:MAG: glycoside hydrolase family 71/99-like protein [Chthoniobacteraceae bacterium]